jgi:hypothetical protein
MNHDTIPPLCVAALLVVWGCGPDAGSAERAVASGAAPVQTADWPSDACGWVPAAEVEALIGPFAAEPEPVEGACRYTLVIPDSVSLKREQAIELRRHLGVSGWEGGDDDLYAVDLHVDPDPDIAAELGLSAGQATVAGWLDAPEESRTDEAPADGWDYRSSTMGRPGMMGRLGHLGVTVMAQTFEIPSETIIPLAERARDRITDLPFATLRESPTTRNDRNPCSLLTRAEAEAVLGPLIVAPYRSAEGSPLVDPGGGSCAYYTTGHHVLLLTPMWSYGSSAIEAARGLGNLIGGVVRDHAAEVADTLEGPWDDVAGATGALLFLEGDRLIEITYAMSSTDADGAVQLARAALARLSQ